MKIHTQEVSVRNAEGENVTIGTVEVRLFESWDEVGEAEREKVLTDANRQRIQDAANAFRADYRTGGTALLKREQTAILAKLAAGTHTPADLSRLAEIARTLAK